MKAAVVSRLGGKWEVKEIQLSDAVWFPAWDKPRHGTGGIDDGR